MPLPRQEIERLKRKISLQRSIPLPPFRRFNASIFDTAGCIYIHIPKTAGTSIRNALAQLPNPIRRRYPRLRKHARAFEYRAAVGESLWQQYFSFAFVRNPFDLMVSSYFWWLEKAHKFRKLDRLRAEVEGMADFNEFISSRFGREYVNEYPGDMFDWIAENGEIIVDFVGRVENLDDDWKTICGKIGVPFVELAHVNRTSRGDYREYYNQASIDLVAHRFQKTIEIFGYRF
jgi:hypothetical protein